MNNSVDLFTIASSKYYRVVEATVSRYWKIVMNASNKNIVYFGRDFRSFSYVGIDRFISEQDFFAKYHHEDEGVLSYLAQMMNLLEKEALSMVSTS